MMKKLLGIVVLGLLLCGNAYADFWKSDSWKNIERMNSENRKQRALEDEIRKQGNESISEYWSLSRVGPKSQNEAIEMFFKGRKLDPIEGVWKDGDWGVVAITKFGSNYRKYYVDVRLPEENGSWGGTLKSISPKKFEYYTRWTEKESDEISYLTRVGHHVLINNNYIDSKVYEDNDYYETIKQVIRIWPSDLETWNSKIKTVKKTTNDSSEKDKLLEQLKILNELYKEGSLTDEEFSKAKKKLLN